MPGQMELQLSHGRIPIPANVKERHADQLARQGKATKPKQCSVVKALAPLVPKKESKS